MDRPVLYGAMLKRFAPVSLGVVAFIAVTEAHAVTAVELCKFALTTLVTKGPKPATRVWRHFAHSDGYHFDPLRTSLRMFVAESELAALAAEVPRLRVASNLDEALLEIIRDPGRSEAAIRHVVRVAGSARDVRRPDRILNELRADPRVADPSDLLEIPLNPNFALPRAEVEALVREILRRETREDLGENDVPFSARAGTPINLLHAAGRIRTEACLDAYAYMFTNPLASPTGLYWVHGDFQLWIETLFIKGRPLPSVESVERVIAKLRQRLEGDQSRRTLTTLKQLEATERLLGI